MNVAKKIAEISQQRGEYQLEFAQNHSIYFTALEIPKIQSIKKTQFQIHIQRQINKVLSEYYLNKQQISRYFLKYLDYVLSYPYICFLHAPIIGNLRNFMKNKLTYQTKINLMAAIAIAVEDIHLKRICLRALRPEMIAIVEVNYSEVSVLLMEMTEIKQLDEYNLVKGQLEKNNPYVAPQITHHNFHSTQCDIWSLGLIFGQIMCGVFRDNYDQTKSNQNIFTQKIPDWFQKFIRKMVIIKPQDRYKIKEVTFILTKAQFCSQSFQKFY